MKTEQRWYEEREELLSFARVMKELGAFGCGADEADTVLYYIEKPWKWTEEHDDWVSLGRPSADDPIFVDVRELGEEISDALKDALLARSLSEGGMGA